MERKQYVSVSDVVGGYVNELDRQIEANIKNLLGKVNDLLDLYVKATGNPVERSQVTGTCLSGPNAGLRPKNSRVGAANSSHKEGRAVDLADRTRKLKDWLILPTHRSMELCGLYMEHPVDTPTWCHLTTRKPPSGNRVFHA